MSLRRGREFGDHESIPTSFLALLLLFRELIDTSSVKFQQAPIFGMCQEYLSSDSVRHHLFRANEIQLILFRWSHKVYVNRSIRITSWICKPISRGCRCN